MKKHTPGPWKYQVNRYGDNKSGVIDAAESKHMILSEPIAIIPHDDCDRKQYRMAKANARLIAASPMLLEALKTLRNMNQMRNDYDSEMYDIADEAIAAAEGKEGA